MEKEILNDITRYIDFLRESGYSVTLSCFDPAFKGCLPTLLEYEVHLPPICAYLKMNKGTYGKCTQNKQKLTHRQTDKPYYSCCYAGVEEFVIPVRYGQTTVMCINVSGYRGQMPQSRYLMERVAKQCDRRFLTLYQDLSDTVPDMERILIITKPLIYMIRTLFEACRTAPPETPQERIYRLALAYIYENYMHPITCEDVAKAAHYSPSYLRHVFQVCGGMSVAAFINSVRLSQAETLLKTTTLSITRIAADIGFCDANYFSAVFKKKHGVPPKEFRK